MTPIDPMTPAMSQLMVQAGGGVVSQSSSSGVLSQLVPLLVALGVLVIIGGMVISWARRSLLEKDSGDDSVVELPELRRLRDSGAISREEYEVARDALIGRAPGEPPPPTRARRRLGADGSLIAAPGFDLTGEPLPDAHLDTRDNDDEDDGNNGGAGVPA